MTVNSVCRVTVATALVFLPITVSAVEPTGDRVSAVVDGATVPVTVDNFVTADTAGHFGRFIKMAGGINKLVSFREPTPIDKQSVVRMNRDTLYSFAVIDISKGAKLTLPKTDGRYNSAAIVNEHEYINKVFYEPGTHKLTKEEFDTIFVVVVVRTLVNSSDPADIRKANELQDKLRIEAGSAEPFTPPNYNEKSFAELRDLLQEVAKFLPDTDGAFGSRENTEQVPHLLGAAIGWGGLPSQDAFYQTVNPDLPVGRYQIDVPSGTKIELDHADPCGFEIGRFSIRLPSQFGIA